MNQISLSGINSNPVLSDRPKPSATNIVGFCGFSLFALVEIVCFSLYYYVMSAIESGAANENIEFYQSLFTIRAIITKVVFPIAYLAIGYFFVMDMMKRVGGQKFIDIIGLMAIVLLLIICLRAILMDFTDRSSEEIREIIKINNYIWYSGIILLMLFFAGFWGNAKLLFPSLFVVLFTIAHWTFFLIRTEDNYMSNHQLGTCADILAICSMAWFMYKYMCIGGAEVKFGIKIKPESQVTLRSVATALCVIIGIATLFVPFITLSSWDVYNSSLYKIASWLSKIGFDSYEIYKVLIPFIPAIVLYAAAIMDKGIVKPIIAMILSVIPFIWLLSDGLKLNNWGVLMVVLYVVLVGLTIAIAANSPKQKKPASEAAPE